MTKDNFALLSAFSVAGGSLAALNSGEGYGNVVTLKKYSYNGHAYPYVSGQSIRFALRNTIREQVGSESACIYDKEGHSCGNPRSCVLCDLMGFMKAQPAPPAQKELNKDIKSLEDKTKKATGKDLEDLRTKIALLKASLPEAQRRDELNKQVKDARERLKEARQKPGTLSEKQMTDLKNEINTALQELEQLYPRDKRQSPLQVSPFMGLIPLEDSLVTDFLTSEKTSEEQGKTEKAIANIEASKNVYMGAWALDLRRVGAYDLLDPVSQTLTWQPIYNGQDNQVDLRIRDRRVTALLTAFRNLTGFAKQARMMDSLEADLVVFCLSPVYSHLLIKLAHGTTTEKGQVRINKELWQQVIGDLRTSGSRFYAGIRMGFLSKEKEEELKSVFVNGEIAGSPHAAYDAVSKLFGVEKEGK